MTKWMDVAWTQLGQAEVSGTAANPQIIEYFRRVGHGEITSDEVAWCAAFVGWCLIEAGIAEADLPNAADRLLARSYLKFGTPIDVPRVGAIAVFSRGSDPVHGHVGFVTGATDTHIVLLGGNQANRVSTMHIAKGRLIGIRWPTTMTAGELAAAGSRTVAAAGGVGRDAVAVSAATATATGASAVADLPDMRHVAGQVRDGMGMVDLAHDFGRFAVTKWPLIAGLLVAYWAVRILWRSDLIKRWRVADANTGAHVGR